MNKSEVTKMFEETYVLNQYIDELADLLSRAHFEVLVGEHDDSWFVKGLQSKEIRATFDGIVLMLASSYAYGDSRGILKIHYLKYLDKWTRDTPVVIQVIDYPVDKLMEQVVLYTNELIRRRKEYRRQAFVLT